MTLRQINFLVGSNALSCDEFQAKMAPFLLYRSGRRASLCSPQAVLETSRRQTKVDKLTRLVAPDMDSNRESPQQSQS